MRSRVAGRDRNDEVDYVVRAGATLWALEVKSGRPARPRGMEAFRRAHRNAVPVIVGTGGVSLETFFSAEPSDLLRSLARR